MQNYTVRDGRRTLQFTGELLSTSTSKLRGSGRWVEFELYRTVGGQYVLARIGVSHYYHSGDCSVVKRNSIPAAEFGTLEGDWLECKECASMPDTDGTVYPEQPRYWAQAASNPESVLESLYKYDDNHTRYLTRVADRLLADAAEKDETIRRVYMTEEIA